MMKSDEPELWYVDRLAIIDSPFSGKEESD